MVGERLQRAWGGHGEGPCATFDCPMQARCAAAETACWAFLTFVRSGRVLRPGTRVTKSAGIGKGPRTVVDSPPEPTREIYAAVFCGDDEDAAARQVVVHLGGEDVGVQVG